jgi:aryl-alcohol dehydrogenase-like predicted oxidoreductase
MSDQPPTRNDAAPPAAPTNPFEPRDAPAPIVPFAVPLAPLALSAPTDAVVEPFAAPADVPLSALTDAVVEPFSAPVDSSPASADASLESLAASADVPPAASVPAAPLAAVSSPAVESSRPATPPAQVRLRPLGTTGLDVPELALGTWGLSGDGYGPVSNREAEATLQRAVELGVTLFETSDAYGKGAMESLLGRVLAPHGDRVMICTRHGVDRSSRPAKKRFDVPYLRQAVDATLARLRRPSIDIYLLHNPSVGPLVRPELIAFLRELKDSGKVKAWGVSVGDAEVGRVAIDAGAEVIEVAYNALFSGDFHALASDVARNRIGVLARSVLSYGLLVGAWPSGKTFPEGDHRRDRWIDGMELFTRMAQLDAVRSLISSEVQTLRAAALRFVLANHLVSSAVLGPRSVAQLEQLVREAGKGPPYLDENRLSELPVKLSEVGVYAW